MTSEPSGDAATLVGGVGCAHWHSARDVVAVRFRCCGHTYPCLLCHAEAEDHPVTPWPTATDVQRRESAVLCRSCGTWLTVGEYLAVYGVDHGAGAVTDGAGSGADGRPPACPGCGAAFNPGCALHTGIYFDV